MGKPTFLLGVGAQKAGTTWLHRYLCSGSSFAPGLMKEYHVWDTIYGVDPGGPPAFEGTAAAEREGLRQSLVRSPSAYFAHFAGLLSQEEKDLTADITPAYAALPVDALSRIVTGFAERGVNVKAVMLLRDPVERCWSAARMYRRKQANVAGLDHRMEESELVVRYAQTAHCQRRGRYERTVHNLEQCLRPEQIHYAIYEDLFTRESIERMSDFLGRPCDPLFGTETFNVSSKSETLTRTAAAQVAEAFRETLAFCAARFPQTQTLWGSYDLLRAG